MAPATSEEDGSPHLTFLNDHDRAKLCTVFQSRSARFSELIHLVGLNPRTDLRRVNLNGVNFRGSDLRGFDFTGAILTNTNWTGSIYDRSTITAGADLTGCIGRTEEQNSSLSTIFSRAGRAALGTISASYIDLVDRTSAHAMWPEHFDHKGLPAIFVTWHGDQYMMPIALRHIPGAHRSKFLVSRHSDGDAISRAISTFGYGVIRGSGSTAAGQFLRKGGLAAFQSMLNALQEGYSVVLTADVPKMARLAGKGPVKLAQASNRPIVPVAIHCSRRYVLNNWDRTTIALPFGKMGTVFGQPILPPSSPDGSEVERVRNAIQTSLERAFDQAKTLVN